jgi:general secretion pathway protein G
MRKLVYLSVSILVLVGGLKISLSSKFYRDYIQERKYHQAQRDIASLDGAIHEYIRKHGTSPSATQSTSAEVANPERWQDPWGNEYEYSCPGNIHKTGYDLTCYGSDGAPGGQGFAKDITLGKDMVAPVKVVKRTSLLCRQCGRPMSEQEETVEVSYKEAEQYRLTNGQYRPMLASRKGPRICARCAREAKAREQVSNITRNLRIQFSSRPADESVMPGHRIYGVHLEIVNIGSKPVSIANWRFVLGPSNYLVPDLGPPGPLADVFVDRRQIRGLFEELVSTGIPLETDRGGKELNPVDSPYYTPDIIQLSSASSSVYVLPRILLNPQLKPGHDISLDGYLVINGVRNHIGSFTIHVKHPS